ncbi:hypothetical protein MFERI14815_00771 [Mycoplasma feriruminatoris]|nr:hypothetical protein [Mycoplasma feriruminatoris]WFQ92154.1 hypothetical protein MFERI14815_00771 [Mycoplasma feriruminatoris]
MIIGTIVRTKNKRNKERKALENIDFSIFDNTSNLISPMIPENKEIQQEIITANSLLVLFFFTLFI